MKVNSLILVSILIAGYGCNRPTESEQKSASKLASESESEELPQSTHPVWSPDGSRIAFINNKTGIANNNAINFEIYVMNANGSEIHQLTHNTAFEADIAWSPNGQMIAFKSYRDQNDEIYIKDLESGDEYNISNNEAREGGPQWSSDGMELYFQSNRDHEKGELYSYDLKTKEIKRITSNDFAENGAVWSPDGKRLAFTSDKDGDDDIYVMDISGENLIQLTNNELMDWYPRWSPDGSKILFTYGDWSTDIFELRLIKADGTKEETIIKGVDSGNASWHPDGTQIAFGSMKSGPGEVYIFNLDTSKETKLTDNENN